MVSHTFRDRELEEDPEVPLVQLRPRQSFGGDAPLSDKVQPDEGTPDSGGKPSADDENDNPFKQSALVTHQGIALPVDDYMTYLALQFTTDREATLREVTGESDCGSIHYQTTYGLVGPNRRLRCAQEKDHEGPHKAIVPYASPPGGGYWYEWDK
jgi:hypothetical protein